MSLSNRSRYRHFLEGGINLLPNLFLLGGLVGGGFFGSWQYRSGSEVVAGWVKTNCGWEIASFAAFGAMSGFGMASLALIATLSAHERGKEAIDSNSGRLMTRLIVRSTWAWLLPGLVALLHIGLPVPILRAFFVGFAWFAITQGILALLGLTLFFSRFTIPR